MDKKQYTKATIEVIALASKLTVETIGMGSTEEEFGNAKEHGFYFDDEEEDWVKPKSLWDDDDDQEMILEE